jgi:hypothetical protein
MSRIVQKVLAQASEEAGRETGFVQRQSKVTAAKFVQMMVLSCWERNCVSLGDMVDVGETLGVEVSAAGLDQRIDEEAVVLLQRVLRTALAQPAVGEAGACEIFSAFGAVYIEDSSSIRLPAALAGLYRGSGGSASPAAAKVWLHYEYRSGTIAALDLIEGCCADQSCVLPETLLAPGAFHLFDLGYFKLARLAQILARGNDFLCRLQWQTALYTPHHQRIDLEQCLAATSADQLEFEALLGAQVRLPVRILCQRLPEEVVALRQKRARAAARRMRRPLSAQKLRLLAWNLFCTSLPATHWSFDQVLAAYRVRWQVELLFKLFKSDAGLEQMGPWRPHRILCQLYARLIALVLSQILLGPLRFAAPRELSLPKAFRILRRLLPALAQVIAEGWRRLPDLLHQLASRCRRRALKEKRRRKLSTYERLRSLYA